MRDIPESLERWKLQNVYSLKAWLRTGPVWNMKASSWGRGPCETTYEPTSWTSDIHLPQSVPGLQPEPSSPLPVGIRWSSEAGEHWPPSPQLPALLPGRWDRPQETLFRAGH